MKNKVEKTQDHVIAGLNDDICVKTTAKKHALIIESEEQFREFWLNPETHSKYGNLRFIDGKLARKCDAIFDDMVEKGLI